MLAHAGMRKSDTLAGSYDDQATLQLSDHSLAGTKGLNAAVQRRHQHVRVSCNDSITSVSLAAASNTILILLVNNFIPQNVIV